MKFAPIALTGLLFAALATPALAGTGWYVAAGGGWSSAGEVNSASFDSSGAFTLDAGYKWADGLRLEAEGDNASYGAKSLHFSSGGTEPLTGHVDETGGFVNAAYDIPIAPSLSLTAGGGVGFAQVDARNIEGLFVDITGSQTAFAWQLQAGFVWSVCDNVDLNLGYRFQSIGSTKHQDFASAPPQDVTFDTANTNAVMLTLRWYPAMHG